MSRASACRSMLSVCALLAVSPASRADADVLEVGYGGAKWVAGGPQSSAASDDRSAGSVHNLDGSGLGAPETLLPGAVAPARWQQRVAELAARYDISPSLLEAVVWQESRWNERAVSPASARGLAQLMPGTARELGVNPDDPSANLEGGARYLRQQLDAFGGDIEKALAAYNAGPHRVRRANGVPAIRETQNYVAAILARLSAPVRR